MECGASFVSRRGYRAFDPPVSASEAAEATRQSEPEAGTICSSPLQTIDAKLLEGPCAPVEVVHTRSRVGQDLARLQRCATQILTHGCSRVVV